MSGSGSGSGSWGTGGSVCYCCLPQQQTLLLVLLLGLLAVLLGGGGAVTRYCLHSRGRTLTRRGCFPALGWRGEIVRPAPTGARGRRLHMTPSESQQMIREITKAASHGSGRGSGEPVFTKADEGARLRPLPQSPSHALGALNRQRGCISPLPAPHLSLMQSPWPVGVPHESDSGP
jgi:hypothetical protein